MESSAVNKYDCTNDILNTQFIKREPASESDEDDLPLTFTDENGERPKWAGQSVLQSSFEHGTADQKSSVAPVLSESHRSAAQSVKHNCRKQQKSVQRVMEQEKTAGVNSDLDSGLVIKLENNTETVGGEVSQKTGSLPSGVGEDRPIPKSGSLAPGVGDTQEVGSRISNIGLKSLAPSGSNESGGKQMIGAITSNLQPIRPKIGKNNSVSSKQIIGDRITNNLQPIRPKIGNIESSGKQTIGDKNNLQAVTPNLMSTYILYPVVFFPNLPNFQTQPTPIRPASICASQLSQSSTVQQNNNKDCSEENSERLSTTSKDEKSNTSLNEKSTTNSDHESPIRMLQDFHKRTLLAAGCSQGSIPQVSEKVSSDCSKSNKDKFFQLDYESDEKSRTRKWMTERGPYGTKRFKRLENPLQCPICFTQFRFASSRRSHMRVHTGEKPYKCEECNAAFSDRSSYVRHSRIHSGSKPYSCTECGESFARSYTLRMHLRRHSGEKPYLCQFCGMAFSQSTNLKKHIQLHEEEKPGERGCLST